MKRVHLNFLIDAIAFGAFLFLASTGVLLRYQLPPGSGGLNGRGAGRGEALQTVQTLWGWARHDWGAIHYWIACILMAVLAIHLFWHWNWVVCVIQGKSTDRSGWRLGLGVFGLCALVLLAAAPWISPTEQRTREELRQLADQSPPQATGDQPAASPDDIDPPGGQADYSDRLSDRIRGSMSLEQIAALSGVSVGYLIEQVGLPDDVSQTARVGPLLRSHELHMNDLRRAVDEAAREPAGGR
jgi:hypothetical protein